jgi:hypothetical protein
LGGGGACTNGVACGIGVLTSTAGAASAAVGHAKFWNTYSDERLKKDIHDSDLGLDFIEKLRPVSYFFKAGTALMNYGFIAQEVEKALDGRVSSMVTRQKDAMGTYELEYSEIIAPLVKSVQQLKSTGDNEQQQINKERDEIDDLKKLIAAQAKEIADLKKQSQNPTPGAAP